MEAPVNPFGIGVDSYNVMDVVLRNYRRMPRHEWFVQLGNAWPSCDNIALYRAPLRWVLSMATRDELDLVMTSEEREALSALPNRVEVWRGCYLINRAGLSWTIDRTVAESIVSLNRYRREGDTPILRRGLTRRSRAVLKLDRQESEIIATRVYQIVETHIRLRHPEVDPFA